ncbi:MAG TPA: ATP-binding protein [Bacteroidia bacterium]|jgi:PAS domain S-box-containing protein|nr:ATP-binding protein [Bacteroidia bacterium]
MDIFSDNINIDNLDIARKLFKQSRDGFIKLFDNSPICMSMTTTDPQRRVYIRANKKFIETFGFSEKEIIGKTSVEIGILELDESLRVGAVIKEKGRWQNEYIKCLAKDKTPVHTISSIERMEMNDNTYLISFFINISEMVKQHVVIEQYAQQLEVANKELEGFSYTVAHDLRAPLRAIDGYAKILENDYKSFLDDDGKKILGIVRDNTQRMNNLINDLLAFARVGKGAFKEELISMDKLINEIITDIKSVNTYKAEVNVAQLHPVKGDYALMKQVMFNLLSNALKYSSKKDSPVIEVLSEVKGDQLIYTVKDNGDGFDMRYVDKLFGVFQRLHTDDEFEGTGVGLAIVQRIIAKHGGKVSAEGQLGKGAVFRVMLPAIEDSAV